MSLRSSRVIIENASAPSPSNALSSTTISWLGTDLERLYLQYPSLFSKDELLRTRLGIHTNIVSENIDLRSQIANLVKENELLKLSNVRISESDKHIQALLEENQRTVVSLNEKARECESWKVKFAEADELAHRTNVMNSVMTKENTHLCNEQTNAKEQIAQYETLKVQFAHLSADYAAINHTKDRLIAMLNERDQQNSALTLRLSIIDQHVHTINALEQERAVLNKALEVREGFVHECTTKISQLESLLSEQKNCGTELTSKLTQMAEENKRLAVIISDRTKEIENLRTSNGELSDVEKRLTLTTLERENMKVTISENETSIDAFVRERNTLQENLRSKTIECENLKERVKSLEDQITLIPILKEKLNSLHSDFEAKATLAVEQAVQIQKLNTQITQIGNIEQRLALLLVEKERLQQEKIKLNVYLAEHKETINKLEIRSQQADRLDTNVGDLAIERQNLREAVIEKVRENDVLKVKNAAIPDLESKLEISFQNRNALAGLVQEREKTISELMVKIGLLEAQLADYEAVKSKLTIYMSENEKLSVIIGEKLKDIDNLKFRITQLTEVESHLSITSEEKSRLLATLTEKLAEIDSLKAALLEAKSWEPRCKAVQSDRDQLSVLLSEKLRLLDAQTLQIAELQVECAKIPDLQARIALLASENERLNVIIVEKIRIIDEWAVRYHSLEQLYLNIKETTEQLDFVKRKYETVVASHQAKEIELKASQELRRSAYYGTLITTKTISSNSDALTEGSPLVVENLKKSIVNL